MMTPITRHKILRNTQKIRLRVLVDTSKYPPEKYAARTSESRVEKLISGFLFRVAKGSLSLRED